LKKKIALFCGVLIHVDVINEEMLPIGTAGFAGFCPLTLLHLCRAERGLSSLALVPTPYRHKAPLYFWCKTKRSCSQTPYSAEQSLDLLSVYSSML